MRSISFRVDGHLPPKKDGAISMWGKPAEAGRLVALRIAALQALGGLPPFERNMRLALKVHVGPTNDRRAGDLDNYVTGVCDGLMAANPLSSVHPLLRTPERPDIDPSRDLPLNISSRRT